MHGFAPARILGSWYSRPVVYQCHDFAENGRSLHLALAQSAFEGACQKCGPSSRTDADRAIVVAEQLQLKRQLLIAATRL